MSQMFDIPGGLRWQDYVSMRDRAKKAEERAEAAEQKVEKLKKELAAVTTEADEEVARLERIIIDHDIGCED
jgi:DNA topoisomerase VI subunit B